MQRKAFIVSLVVGAVVLGGCTAPEPSGEPSSEQLQVLTTFYPLQYISKRIAGEQADVVNITPPSTDPHNLELSPMQVRTIGEADLIVHLSGGFQSAVDEALNVIENVQSVDTVELTDGRPGDPHFWLDPLRLAQAGDLVAQALGEIDPVQSELYQERAEELSQELQALDTEMGRVLEPCRGATLVTSHEAFGFLADRYGLDQVGINGIDPEQEASPARLRAVAEVVADRDVQTLFFEVAASDKMIQILATDLGVDVAVLSTMERSVDGEDYLEIMRQNLAALESGLECG